MASDAVWALDLGSSSLKALRLSLSGEAAQVTGFEVIPHAKILSGKGITAVEKEEMIALALRQFVQRSGISDEQVIVSVPGQNSFARFVNLPPVEAKKIPEIVRFEAMQQIPFDINEVQWDWQLMGDPASTDKRVGLFAIKNEIVTEEMDRYGHEDLSVATVQMAPMALYNWLLYDRPDLVSSDDRAVVVLNIGAEITDLVACTKSGVWQRCILIGGNAFTQAIADAFKINFEKAEKLKRTAAVSKYARQILQAMKPVFTDLVGEVQKSLGFYTNANPNVRVSRIVAMGGGTRLRGLLKYLQQSLQIPVERPDAFKRLALSSGVSAAKFHEAVPELAVVYGLAVQGEGISKIQSNLLPKSIARSIAWAEKTKYFYAAAGLLLLVSLLALGRVALDNASYGRNQAVRMQIAGAVDRVNESQRQLEDEKAKSVELQSRIRKVFERFVYRDTIPLVYQTVLSALPNARNNPAQAKLYEAFAAGDLDTVKSTRRKDRKQIFITSCSIRYAEDLVATQFSEVDWMQPGAMPGYGNVQGPAYAPDARAEAPVTMQLEPTPEPVEAAAGEVPTAPPSGFVVTLEGYSPYRDIGDLLDPAGVDKQPEKWGLVTRLLNLQSADPASPFVLLDKGKASHFEIDKGPVDPNTQRMPRGIGVPRAPEAGTGVQNPNEQVLVDPMTQEVISRVRVAREGARSTLARAARETVEDNDWWFVLKFKLAWKDAPAVAAPAMDAAAAASTYGQPPQAAPAGGVLPE